jgi:hypothetical protein
VRTHAALAGTLALLGCAGPVPNSGRAPDGPGRFEPRPSYRGMRPGMQGCLYGNCRNAGFVRRTGDRTVSGWAGARELSIEWEAGGCMPWRYRGEVAGDLPDGRGTLTAVDRPPLGVPFTSITGTFSRGRLAGPATAQAWVTGSSEQLAISATFAIDEWCAIAVSNRDLVDIDALPLSGTRGPSRFRGLVRIGDTWITPVRGWLAAIDDVGYVDEHVKGGYFLSPAACLTTSCTDGDGVELVNLDLGFELYRGEFKHGIRHSRAVVQRAEPGGARELQTIYGDGGLWSVTLHRRDYLITDGGRLMVATALDEIRPVTITVGTADALTFPAHWSSDNGIDEPVFGTLSPALARQAPGVPAKLPPDLAALSLLLPDLRRAADPRHVVLGKYGYVTHGPTTIAVFELEVPNPRLAMVWLPDTRQMLRAVSLAIDDEGGPPALTGTADLIGPGGRARRIALYRGERVDPLGYATPAAYLAASEATVTQRAEAWARKAAALRRKDAGVMVALREVLDAIGIQTTALAEAATTLAERSAAPAAAERTIHAAEAAIERAMVSAATAHTAGLTALPALGADDPLLPVLGALIAQLGDHRDRLAVLFEAFGKFQYTEDLPRLEAIRRTLATAVGTIAPAPITAGAAQLRDGLAGAPVTTTPAAPPR